MVFGLKECREYEGNDGVGVVADELHHTLVVPEVRGPLGHLEVRTGHTLGDLLEERLHHLWWEMDEKWVGGRWMRSEWVEDG